MKNLLRKISIKHLAVILIIAVPATVGAYLAQSSAATVCTVSSKLVNSCRPWLGGRAGQYPGVASDPKSQLLAHESRIGRNVEIAHVYHTAGQALNSDDLYFINRANTYLFADWKPAADWTAGSDPTNATTNASIDKMADSIKAISPKKLFLTVWHEPQNDVNNGTYPCTAAVGNKGTTAQYRAMWQNVRNRFNAKGVANVVWAIDYQSYEPLDCMINDLYPGDSLVDWVVTNGYGNANQADYTKNIKHYYDFFTNNTNATHSYTSKTWGIIEWNIQGVTGSVGAAYYKAAQTALDNNTFPRLKMHVVFDSIGPDIPVKDYRVNYDNSGALSAVKQNAYTAFAQDPRFTDAFYTGGVPPPPPPPPPPPADTTPPSVTLTNPANHETVFGAVTVSGTASDNVGVASVSFVVDGNSKVSDTSSPYSYSLDTTKLNDGDHTLSLHAVDGAGNFANSSTITVSVHNATVDSGGNGGVSSGIISVSPDASLKIDGKPVKGTSIDTTKLTNGDHTVTVTENGKSKQLKINVQNPWRTALVNNLRAHAVAYSVAAGSTLLILAAVVVYFVRKLRLHNRNRNLVSFEDDGAHIIQPTE